MSDSIDDTQTGTETTTTDFNILTENLALLPQKLTEAAFNIILQRAFLIQGLAQVYVPVKTGWLRDHINVVIVENSEQRKTVSIVIDVPYAVYVEAKQPFLGPAVAEVQPDIEDALRSLQESVIDGASK